MIGHYLPNNNENATVPILPKILYLNKAPKKILWLILIKVPMQRKVKGENLEFSVVQTSSLDQWG